MPTYTDEVFDASGKVIATSQRTTTDVPFTAAEYRAARRAVKTVLAADAVPAWGKALARFLLMVSFVDSDDEPAP